MKPLRTFIAVDASDDVRSRALDLIERLRQSQASVRWVAAANLHWTIKFLGDVEAEATAEVCQRVAGAVADLAPFRIEARGAGAFPKPDRPRTLWLGAGEGQSAMSDLARAVDDSLGPIGFRREARQFFPHLTLGRVRGAGQSGSLAGAVGQNADFDAGSMDVHEVVVYSSHLEPGGPVHQPLGRATLGGTRKN